MLNVGKQSLRRKIIVKYLLTDNVPKYLSRNNLILKYRDFRNKMSALEELFLKMFCSCELEYQKLELSQSADMNNICKILACSTKENRLETYIKCVNLLADFINGQSVNEDRPFSKNELKALIMLTGNMFVLAGQYMVELNMK